MKNLYLECSMGAAGDMLMSALLELHPNPDEFIARLNGLNIPGVSVTRETVTRCGIRGTSVRVEIHGHEEDEHMHEHHHEHSHGHHHTGIKEIRDIVAQLNISEKVRTDVTEVYNLIAEAESHAHGKSVELIHFHEVGAMDAVADIVGVCMLLDELAPDKIKVSQVHVGSGSVKCAHGILPVPAPATAHILRGVPTYGGAVDGELCTPTGAALLKHFADEFVETNAMRVDKIGYGMGKRHFYDKNGSEILSAVRAMLGESENKDEIIMLSCNLDDMTGEQIGFAAEILLAKGARDVYTSPIYMKKNRPGILLTVICTEEEKQKMLELIFKHTTTIGIREEKITRHVLDRSIELESTPYGDVRIKKSEGFGITKRKAEYEDLKKIALENDIFVGDVM